MEQVAYINLDKTWRKVEEVISTKLGETFTFDSSKTYQIQFSEGDGPALFIAPSSIDSVASNEGFRIYSVGDTKVIYKKSTNDLYAKAFATNCSVNVSELGE